jgi:hypothetical protein
MRLNQCVLYNIVNTEMLFRRKISIILKSKATYGWISSYLQHQHAGILVYAKSTVKNGHTCQSHQHDLKNLF